jgi:uncharacterized membrane protein
MRVARRVAFVLLGIFLMVAGLNHFAHPRPYERIVPAWLPAPGVLVAISGVCEILGGVGVLFPATRKLAGIGLIALLIAVFPANLNMAQNPGHYADLGTPALLYARLPLQLVLIAWVWWVCFFRRGII